MSGASIAVRPIEHRGSEVVVRVVGAHIGTAAALVPLRARPTVLALLLALIAWPLVALTLHGSDPVRIAGGRPVPASALAEWSAAAGGVFLPALIAGWIGGLAVRRHAVLGAALTFVLALWLAVATVFLVPTLIGQPIGFGCTGGVAGGSSQCNVVFASTRAPTPTEDVQLLPFLWAAPFVEPVPVLILLVGVGVWAYLLAGPRPVGGKAF